MLFKQQFCIQLIWKKKTVEDIRKIFANHGINDKYIDLFVKKAEKVGIMEM